MANTNVQTVKSYFGSEKISESGLDDEFIQVCINDAIIKVSIDDVGEQFKEYAQRLYACHLICKRINVDSSPDGNVVLEKVGSLQTQYKKYDGYNKYDDPFESEYEKLLKSLGLGYTVAKFI